MTHEQKQQVQHRQERIQPRCEGSVSSQGEGTSRPKGKAIDPKEWGNLDLSDKELGIGAQAAALDSFKKMAQPKYTNERNSQGTKEKSASPHRECAQQHDHRASRQHYKQSERPAESQLSTQIAPKSYLGSALKKVGHQRTSKYAFKSPPNHEFDMSSPDESPSTPSSDSSDNSSQSDENSDDHWRPRIHQQDNCHGRNK